MPAPLSLQQLRLPLFWQILMAMTLLVSLTIGILWGYLGANFNHLLQQQNQAFANTISEQLANSAAEMLMADDQLAISAMLENLTNNDSNIEYLAIYNENNTLVSQAGALQTQIEATGVSQNVFRSEIRFQQVNAGYLELKLNNQKILQSLKSARTTTGIIASVLALVALIMSILMAKTLTAPLKRLQKAVGTVALGELNPKLPKSKNDEVGDLIFSIDKMLQGLRDKVSIEKKFSTYISKDIAKDILSDLSGQKKPLRPVYGSVLFVDIVGFTQMCEEQSPEDIADILNEYYFLLHQAAKMYRGSVDNYIGDGAMLTFGVHKQDHKHSINGICAGQIFLRLAQQMNQQRESKGKKQLSFRLGLHCGEMLAGTIGSDERMQFTISGDTVNMAARLCDKASPDKLLISHNIYQHPASQDLILTEPAQTLAIKGKALSITAHHIRGLAPKFNRLLMQQETEIKDLKHHA